MLRLYALSGSDVGRSATVEDGDLVGRAEEATLRLADRSISRRHARLERRGEAWFLVDLGSTNGLWADDERVPEVRLEDLTEARVGEVRLRARFEAEGSEAEGSTSPAARPAEPPPPAAPPVEVQITSGGGVARSDPSTGSAAEPAEDLAIEWDEEIDLSAAPARPAVREPIETAAQLRERQRAELLRGMQRPPDGGLLRADLSQVAGGTRAALYVVVLLVAVGVLYGVAQLVLSMR